MKQHELVIDAMRRNGGYATLGQLYKMVDIANWGTKTPFASIRRIVQQRSEIFKIRPGLWALEEYRHQLPVEIYPSKNATQEEKKISEHYFYQGLLVELGKMENYKTYIPAQDKNRLFLLAKKNLGEVADLTECPLFTYSNIIQRVKSIDVIWFNEREYPFAVYEVEHTTDFKNSLGKFVALQDFHVKLRIVADTTRQSEFESKLAYTEFSAIKNRVEFFDYKKISDWHDKASELQLIKS